MKKLYSISILALITFSATAQSWWPQTSNTTKNLQNINFYDNYVGYSFGDTLSTMVKTGNRGFLWSPVTPTFTQGDLFSSAFLNSSSVVVAVGVHNILGGTGLVMKTTNYGSTWTSNTTIPEQLFDVSFANATNGWICGQNGYIARTTDGGTNWLQLTTGTGEDIFSVYFVNANEGWAVGTVDTSAMILRTTNAGTNWTRQSSALLSSLFSVFFINNTTGWAVGAGGKILATTNGGTTWIKQTSGVSNDLLDVSFISPLKGWVTGASGTILKTINGGTTWTPETSGTTVSLNSIIMKNDTLGWVCGGGGTIRVYGNSPPNSVKEITQQNSSLIIYPNPVSDVATVSFENFNGAQWNFTLTDVNGKKIMEQTNIRQQTLLFNRNGISPGIYFYHTTTEKNVMTNGKIIIQ